METTKTEVRRANLQDIPQLQKLWWANYPEPNALAARYSEFQVAVENGRVIAVLGLHVTELQGNIWGEAVADPRRTDEMRALFWPRFQTWAKNFGLFRLWTALPGEFWASKGFQPLDPNVAVPPPFNTGEAPNITLQLGPEPSKAAKALAELAMVQEGSRGRGKNFLGKVKTFAIVAPPVITLCFFGIRLVMISKLRVPRPRVYVQPAHPSTPVPMQNGMITISNDDPILDPTNKATVTNVATATNAAALPQK
jgi:N-acetylglutamate synthase-like GNAT family acetyltransferase